MSEPGGILLAAGASTRFGVSKLLHPLPDGTPVGIAAARTLVEVVPNAVAVVRAEDQGLAEKLSAIGLGIIENPLADKGMSSSLAAGIAALPNCSGWLIALGDMPWVKTATIRALADSLEKGASIVAPSFDGQRGNPVGFSSRWKADLQNLSGDQGARRLIAEHAADLEMLKVQDPGVISDVDYPDDLSRKP